MTAAQRRGLEVLSAGPLTPSQFAKKMWPDSPAWKRHGKCGPSGSHAGVAMPSAGGAMIARLRKLGWVTWAPKTVGHYARHELTEAGRAALRAEAERCLHPGCTNPADPDRETFEGLCEEHGADEEPDDVEVYGEEAFGE